MKDDVHPKMRARPETLFKPIRTVGEISAAIKEGDWINALGKTLVHFVPATYTNCPRFLRI